MSSRTAFARTGTRTRVLGAGASLALLAGGLTACGGDSAAVDGSLELYGHTVEFDQALADRVPEEWKGGVTVPIQVLRPNAFVDEDGEPVGLQPDLLHAISTTLGIEVSMEVAPFDAQVPGVQSGQYAFTTATGDFPERHEVLTMVDYTVAGLGWMAPAGGDITEPSDICGKNIGVAKGTNQERLVEDVIAACEAAGKTGTKSTGFSNTLMSVPLEAGRIDVTYDSISSVLYFTEFESEKFEMVGDPELGAPIALGVKAGEQEKAELLRDTVQSLIDSGVYTAVFEEWNLTELALDQAYINREGLELDVERNKIA